jgi:hypothetical protein
MEQDIHEALETAAQDIRDITGTGIEESQTIIKDMHFKLWLHRRICGFPTEWYKDKLGQPYYEASVSIKGIPLLFDTGACVMWDFDLDKLVERLHEVINRHEELELTRQQQVE